MCGSSPPRARTPDTEASGRGRRRRRLAVALVPAGALGQQIDGLRRACGDPTLGRVPPHVTVAHPVNVADERLAEVAEHLRAVAGHAAPLRLTLGPVELFAATPTAYLAVGGDLDGLSRLRTALRRGPLTGTFDRDYVAHLTIARGLDPARLTAIAQALGDFRATWTADRVHLLAEGEDRSWTPIAEARLGRRDVVGQGGLAVELTRSVLPDEDAAALTGTVRTVTARRDGRVVGVAIGRVRGDDLVVDVVETAAGEDAELVELLLDRLARDD